jgi:hypothetical protein
VSRRNFLDDSILLLAVGLLAVLFAAAIRSGADLPGNEGLRARSGDFSQFYTAGLLANRGEIDRLYDQAYFFGLQRDWKEDGGLFSLYPPMMALLMMPLARLPFYTALVVWWGLQAACFAAAGWILYGMMNLSRRWRVIALAALANLFPLAIAVRMAHLTPMLLLVLAGGIVLHRRGKTVSAGLLLSLLAIKPQLALGLVLWLCLRRDLRTLAGVAAGMLAQAAAVAAAFGPAVFRDYLQQLPVIAAICRRLFHYSPIFEQSASGIVDNLLWVHGADRGVRTVAMIAAHILVAATASILLVRTVSAARPFGVGRKALSPGRQPADAVSPGRQPRDAVSPGRQPRDADGRRSEPGTPWVAHAAQYEYAAAVLFMLLFPPYLLVYDLLLLAVPLVLLWSTPRWPVGVVLYATATMLAATLAMWTGFSLTGLAALWAMFEIALAMRPATAGPRCSTLVPTGHHA